MKTSAPALEVSTEPLTAAVRKQAAAFAEIFRRENVIQQLRAALSASETGGWNPDLNKAARTLTEIHPADYHGGAAPERRRHFDRSGWVAMPDRILTFAEDRLRADVDRIQRGLQKAHGETTGIRYVIWAGMGGSSEIVRAISGVAAVTAAGHRRVRLFVLDGSGPTSLKGVLEQILRLESRRGPVAGHGRAKHEALLVRALERTVVLGVSMGMTSEEPVINMTALEKIYAGQKRFPAAQIGAHFWAMTLEGSTLHEFLKVKGWGDHRIALQLDGENRSTLSGRNSYGSRVGLLPFAFFGAPVRPYIAAQASPRFTDDDRLRSFDLGAALVAAEAAGFSQPTFLLPARFQPVGFWLVQQMEESLGKDARHLFKVDIAAAEGVTSLWPARNARQKRVFVHVLAEREKDVHARLALSLAKQGYPVITVRLGVGDGPLGAMPTLLHAWTHAVFAAGYLWSIDTVGQYYVEMYKKYVQLFIVEAMAKGGFGELTFETINTPAATQAKQSWLRRADQSKGAFTDTEPWKRLVSSRHQATGDGLTLYYAGLLGKSPRLRQADLAQGLRAIGVRDAPKADAAQIYAAWLVLAARDTKTSYAELTFYGDLLQTPGGRALAAELSALAGDLYGKDLGLAAHVVEGPRDNHSRLEMSTAGRNEGLITLLTSSLERLKAGSSAAIGNPDTLDGYLRSLVQSYPAEYLPMQTLATLQSYLDHGRRVVLIAGDLTPDRVARFGKQVRKYVAKARQR